ncbi:MAG: ACT domain-containing protein, partial [Salinibacterium amurskyense]
STHANLPILPIARVMTRYQITLTVVDEPGVLATIAAVFSDHHVSVEAVNQTVGAVVEGVPSATLITVTHEATDESLAATVAALAENSVVREVVSVLRVEGL